MHLSMPQESAAVQHRFRVLGPAKVYFAVTGREDLRVYNHLPALMSDAETEIKYKGQFTTYCLFQSSLTVIHVTLSSTTTSTNLSLL